MKLKRIISGFMVGLVLTSFVGCGDKNTYDIKFNPSKEDEYDVTSIIEMDATQGGQKVAFDANVKGNIKYIDVSENEITEEIGYDDFSMNMDIGGAISVEINEENEMFKDAIDKLKSSKITATVDREGNILTYDVEGAEEIESSFDSLNLTSEDSALAIDNSCMLENIKIKEGEEIIISLDKLLGKDTENKLGVNVEGATLQGKVKSIKDSVAEIVFNIDNVKSDTNDISFKNFNCNIKVNVDTGITESIKMNTEVEGSIQGKVKIESTMEKK